MSKGKFQDTAVRQAIGQLYKEINSFNKANSRDTLSILRGHGPTQRLSHTGEVKIMTEKLLPIYDLLQRLGNVVLLASAIIRYLQSGEFVQPELFPMSPIEEMDVELARETVTEEDILEFLNRRNRGSGSEA